YEATASVQIEPRLPDLLGTGDLLNAAAGGNATEYYKQQKQVLGSYTLARLTIEQYDLVPKLLTESERKELPHTDQLDLATERLKKAITIRYPEQDRIMYVAVRNSDPEAAMQIANDHVTTYVGYAKGKLTLNSTTASSA